MTSTLRALGLALVLGAIAIPAARADMVMTWPDLALVGEPATVTGVPTEASFVLTNTGSDPEVVTEPHLVLLDDGIRVPLRITGYEIDGVSHGRFEELTLAPGSSVRVHVVFRDITDRGQRSFELALSFRGMRAPATVTMRRT